MISIITKHPVAADSLDHMYPGATAYDNSIWPPFNAKVFQHWESPRLLDIGCAGGGLVQSIIADGGFAVGIEGSDYSKRMQRAEWATIPGNLFTADATKPFNLQEDGKSLKFDIVTSWEFFEHIPEGRINGVLRNVKKHLKPDGGLFLVSISTQTAGISIEQINADGFLRPAGIEYHVTLHPGEWWLEKLYSQGFQVDTGLTQFFDPDWVRGPLQGCMHSMCAALRYMP
jgi:2-polyprenyl-3-methyl-5-hydroxy-6-metoxy-1,4-benzoquinol methylase